MANDQRLMALRIHEHQEQQLQASTGLFSSSADSSSMLGSCERAASAADLLRMAAAGAAKRGSARVNMQPGSAAAGSGSSSGGLAAAAAGDQVSVLSAASSDLKDVPFEMLVLEVLLDATAGALYGFALVHFVVTHTLPESALCLSWCWRFCWAQQHVSCTAYSCCSCGNLSLHSHPSLRSINRTTTQPHALLCRWVLLYHGAAPQLTICSKVLKNAYVPVFYRILLRGRRVIQGVHRSPAPT
jgi:hypothetical protein